MGPVELVSISMLSGRELRAASQNCMNFDSVGVKKKVKISLLRNKHEASISSIL